MSNKKAVISQIEEFFKSEDKGVLITGTQLYQKHLLAVAWIEKNYKNANVLFRTNALQSVSERSFLGCVGVKKQPKAGEIIPIGKNYYQFDSFNNEGTWDRTGYKFDFAIVYPIDALLRKNNFKAIDDLYEFKEINKIILCSWIDKSSYDYSALNKYCNSHIIYDAIE